VSVDALAEVAQRYDPKHATALGGLEAETIQRLAHDYWHIRPAADPPELRHVAHAQRRQRCAPD
jgi:anaerobic selenocysteine-containing dehydrogenase